MLALALLASAMLATGASNASAVIVQLSSGRTVSYQPVRGVAAARSPLQPFAATENLIYHGGPVMTSNTNYAFYWAPSGSPAYPAGYQAGVNRYLEDLAHDSGGNQNVDSVATQYTNGSGEVVDYDSHFAGAIVDTDPYPKNGCKKAAICLTDAQLQAELKQLRRARTALPQRPRARVLHADPAGRRETASTRPAPNARPAATSAGLLRLPRLASPSAAARSSTPTTPT